MFYKEIVTWGALCHPNVLPLLGIVTDGGQLAMVSEWMTNGTISEFVGEHQDADRFKLVGPRPKC